MERKILIVIKLINNIPAVLENENNNDSMINLNSQVHQALSSKSLINTSSDVINSPTTKRKADESIILDSSKNLQSTNEKAKKIKKF